MKKSASTLALVLFSLLHLAAQSGMTNYDVVEKASWMGNKAQNAYLLAIDADQKLALDSWVSEMDRMGLKSYIADTSQPVVLTEGVLLPEISSQKLDIYVQPQYYGDEDGTVLTFWFMQPDGSFLSSENHPGSFQPISEFLRDFSQQVASNLKTAIHIEELEIAKNRYPPPAGGAN